VAIGLRDTSVRPFDESKVHLDDNFTVESFHTLDSAAGQFLMVDFVTEKSTFGTRADHGQNSDLTE
jgi:hypothetical protein